jgi:hypothetical protein
LQGELVGILTPKGDSKVMVVSAEAQANHTTATQVECLRDNLGELRTIAEVIPSVRSHGNPEDMALSSIRILQGDHAADVQLRKKLLDVDREQHMFFKLGEGIWENMSQVVQEAYFSDARNDIIQKYDKENPENLWETLTATEQEMVLGNDLGETAVKKVGKEKFDAFSKNDQAATWKT